MITALSFSLAAISVVLYLTTKLIRGVVKTSNLNSACLKVLPGPRGWPFVGAAPILAKYPKPWEGFSALRKIYGDVYGLKVGSHYCVVVSSFEAIKEVLVYKAADFANRPNFARFAAIFRGRRDLSVALCDWSEKQRKRRDVTFPVTHPRVKTMGLDQLATSINFTITNLITSLTSLNGHPEKTHDTLLYASANLFYHFLCGRHFETTDSNFVTAIQNYHSIFCDLFRGYPLDFFPWIKFFNGHVLKHLNNLSEEVSRFTEPILEDHAVNLDPDSPRDLVDVLLLSEPGLSRHDSLVIIEDLVGGHSALHNMWMWMVALVGVNPPVAEKIRREVEEIVGDSDVGLGLEDRAKLVYTEATINEVLRVVASPIIPHRTTKETSIQGYAIPKDTLIFFNTCDLNTDENLWADPYTFSPDRFLRDNGTRVFKPEYFIPFGTGKRSCLGDCIVRATLLLGMATLVQKFDIVVSRGHDLLDLKSLPGTVLWPEHDIDVKFVSRT